MVKKRKAKNQGGAGDMDMGDVAAPSAATFSAGAAKDVAAAGFSVASAAVGGADASGEAGGPIAGGNAMVCHARPSHTSEAFHQQPHKSPPCSSVTFPPPRASPTLPLLHTPLRPPPLSPPPPPPPHKLSPPPLLCLICLPFSPFPSAPPIPHPFPSDTSETMGFTVTKAHKSPRCVPHPSGAPSPSPLSSAHPLPPLPHSSPPPLPPLPHSSPPPLLPSPTPPLPLLLPCPLSSPPPLLPPPHQTRVKRWGSRWSRRRLGTPSGVSSSPTPPSSPYPIPRFPDTNTSETMGFTVIKASAESARSTPALPAIRLQKATLSAKATLSLASSADSVQLHAPSVLINLMLLNSPSHTDIHQPSPHTDMLDLVR
ncbi:unnamed protein product [Closterium sp. NIES-65]|nr:unnamed protein product [Closterium sp. NIES-65]